MNIISIEYMFVGAIAIDPSGFLYGNAGVKKLLGESNRIFSGLKTEILNSKVLSLMIPAY